MWGSGFDWMWLFGLLAFVGLVLLVLVVVWAIAGRNWNQARRSGAAAPGGTAKNRPRQILDERYAQGELTLEEYRERLNVLGEGR